MANISELTGNWHYPTRIRFGAAQSRSRWRISVNSISTPLTEPRDNGGDHRRLATADRIEVPTTQGIDRSKFADAWIPKTT